MSIGLAKKAYLFFSINASVGEEGTGVCVAMGEINARAKKPRTSCVSAKGCVPKACVAILEEISLKVIVFDKTKPEGDCFRSN